MEMRANVAAPLKRLAFFYLLAVFGVVIGLILDPLSGPLLAALALLLGAFFLFAMVTLAFSFAMIGVIAADAVVPGFKAYVNARLMTARLNRRFPEPSPARLTLSENRLRALCPELFEPAKGLRNRLVERWGGKAAMRHLIRDQLINGVPRAGVVVSVSPLRVAAYADIVDGVALLAFPDDLAVEHGLSQFSRVLVVNRYFLGESTAPDLTPGPLELLPNTNFRAIVAEFFSDDAERIRVLRSQINEDEWRRAAHLGRNYLEEHGNLARDGRPMQSSIPAMLKSPLEGE